MSKRPFEGSYGASLLVALLALTPFIVVTTAYALFREQLGHDLNAGRTALAVISGIATAGYAFGALLGGDLIQRFPQRPLFFMCESLFVTGCLVAATAGGTVSHGVGQVLLGFATGLLLIVALPPVIRRFPPERMPTTAAMVNIGFFGAVTAGPLIGGVVADAHVWRWFYGGLAGLGLLALGLATVTLPDQAPPNPDLRFDKPAIALALVATALPFWASGELTGHGFGSYWFMVPMAVGIACFVALLLTQYHKKEALSPVKPMWTTLPLVGMIAAMVGGGAMVTLLELAEQFQLRVEHRSALSTGLTFWPQVLGVIVTAALLRVLVRSRYLPVYTLSGMLLLIGGGALLLTAHANGSGVNLLAANALLGLGAGATVSPGLWMAGFSLPSQMVGRTFALVELVRSEADFILAPVMLEVAQFSSAGGGLTADGIRQAIWFTVLITIAIDGRRRCSVHGRRSAPAAPGSQRLDKRESAGRCRPRRSAQRCAAAD